MEQLSFAPELITTGMAAPDEAIEEVHRIDGPVTITSCVRIGERLLWIEHERDQRLSATGVDRTLEAIRVVFGREPWALVPVISDGGSAVFCGLVGARVLVDLLLPGNAVDGDARAALETTFERLGAILASIHERRPDATTLRPLLHRHARVEELARLLARRRVGPQPTLALERLQEVVLCEHPRLADAMGELCATWEHCRGSSILHGAFCPGYIAVADGTLRSDRLQLLGWYDAAFGPPAFDAGWMLGELRELAAARAEDDPADCEVLRTCGRTFLGAYLAARPAVAAGDFVAESDRFAAMKIASHLVSFVRGYGFDDEAVAKQLALARDVLDSGWEPPR